MHPRSSAACGNTGGRWSSPRAATPPPCSSRRKSSTGSPKWVERLRQRAQEAASIPRAGRRVPEVDREHIREVLLRSYRIVHRVVRDDIEVLTIFEGHRLPPGGAVPEDDES
ncbi:type II toxin-antitoxin system RelE/ParE family toxin [Archangium violaceum]|uniref:type II toxin-antitoxin system RelE/ParE family toxin n=1 Tax=Archangium violaceum TaxID=83451 RepID=UPI00193AEE86|nr:type II toxin-antitoxin system RelE/ParE family toxin [Archangium violaceum]QRK10852.1 type II toxin-antitoxin system RelE/ParE family toxin [Archangium violaceum]